MASIIYSKGSTLLLKVDNEEQYIVQHHNGHCSYYSSKAEAFKALLRVKLPKQGVRNARS